VLRTTLRGLLAHRLRLVLAASAVVLGVAFVTGTMVLGDTLTRTFDDLFSDATQRISLEVRAVSTGQAAGEQQRPPIPLAVVDRVRSVGGVTEAFGLVERPGTTIVDRHGRALTTGGAPTLGLTWDPYPDLSSLHLRAGTPPRGGSAVVIDARTATDHGIRVGDRVEIVLPVGQPRTFRVSGIAGFGTSDNLAGATLAAFDPQMGRALLGSPDEVDAVLVKVASGVPVGAVQARVAQALGPGIEVVTGQALATEQSRAVSTLTSTLTTFLLVFALISVFVGSFIILNTFSILVAQRHRELALLRALGATRGQVMRSVVLEATVTGLVASAAGVGAGVLVALGLEALMRSVGLDLGTTPLQVTPRTVVAGLVLGTVVTVLASLLPARRATRVAPVEALRDAVPPSSAVSAARVAAGLGIAAVGVATLCAGLFAVSSHQLPVTGLGALLTFVGVAVLAPLAVTAVIAVIGWPVRRLRGAPGRLAGDNARRNPRRTASTASALMIGVGLVACFTVVAASFKDSVGGLLDRTLTADDVVSPQSAGNPMPAAVAATLRSTPGVATVSEVASGIFHDGAEVDQVGGIDPATIDRVAVIDVQHGAPLSRLGDGEVAISEDAERNHDLRVGDVVPMQFLRPGVRRQRVATVYARNALVGDYLVTLATWRAGNTGSADALDLVKDAPGVSQAELRRRLTAALRGFPGVQVQDNSQYRKSQEGQIGVLLNLIDVLVVLAIVIALLGVMNTVALSIVERTRELGLVRALGMTRGQMRSMVRWETVLITVFGTLLGITVGLFFGVALVHAFSSMGVDTLDLALGQQLGYVLIAFVAGLVAAVLPARRAARIDMLRAITTE
jgi:putative ABC transport system permease protein